MKVSVVIPTYNRNDILPQTLDMVLDQTWPDCQVIVVDQSPVTTDELAEYLAKHDGWIEYYRLPSPNLPAARNFGICRATGEVVIFIDDDVEIPREFVANHMGTYSDPGIGGATGVTVTTWDQTLNEARGGGIEGEGQPAPDQAATVPIKWLGGCNMSYRRRVLIEAGCFDERFTGSAWGEDVDMSARVRRLGHKLVLNPSIRILHLALPSGGCGNRDLRAEEKNLIEHFYLWLFYCAKNRDMVTADEFAGGRFLLGPCGKHTACLWLGNG